MWVISWLKLKPNSSNMFNMVCMPLQGIVDASCHDVMVDSGMLHLYHLFQILIHIVVHQKREWGWLVARIHDKYRHISPWYLSERFAQALDQGLGLCLRLCLSGHGQKITLQSYNQKENRKTTAMIFKNYYFSSASFFGGKFLGFLWDEGCLGDPQPGKLLMRIHGLGLPRLSPLMGL